MGIVAAFFALIVLMTPQSSINLGGGPQSLHGENIVNVGDAGDSASE